MNNHTAYISHSLGRAGAAAHSQKHGGLGVTALCFFQKTHVLNFENLWGGRTFRISSPERPRAITQTKGNCHYTDKRELLLYRQKNICFQKYSNKRARQSRTDFCTTTNVDYAGCCSNQPRNMGCCISTMVHPRQCKHDGSMCLGNSACNKSEFLEAAYPVGLHEQNPHDRHARPELTFLHVSCADFRRAKAAHAKKWDMRESAYWTKSQYEANLRQPHGR